jgi:ABC-type multidrug transport system ATPase subunit
MAAVAALAPNSQISLQGVQKTYPNGTVALKSVNLEIPRQDFVFLVGPSGAGKSTLLGALTGFRPASSGEVRYDDRNLYQNYAELRHRIGFVPQDDILHPQLTVFRALSHAARLRFPPDLPAADREQRIWEVLDELELTELVESISRAVRARRRDGAGRDR